MKTQETTLEINSKNNSLENVTLDEHENEKNAPVKNIKQQETKSKPRRSTHGNIKQKIKPTTFSEEATLIYGVQYVLNLIIPITLCMAFVVFTVTSVSYYTKMDERTIYAPFRDDRSDAVTLLWQSLANAAIFLSIIIGMTFILLLLYKYKFYLVIKGWLLIASVTLLYFFSLVYLEQLLITYNLSLDYITVALIMWNFGVGGLVCIHWKGPLLLQQAYHIMISALIALMFIKFLPDWTLWAVLSVMILWDLYAVLFPKGPLKTLVEIAKTRDETIFPALIYSTTILYQITMTDLEEQTSPIDIQGVNVKTEPQSETAQEEGSTSMSILEAIPEAVENKSLDNIQLKNKKKTFFDKVSWMLVLRKQSSLEKWRASSDLDTGSSVDPPKRISLKRPVIKPTHVNRKSILSKNETLYEKPANEGIKLGLGDFVFYSMLVGKVASKGDWNTTIACYIAILVGLGCTLLLLAVFRKALPALPISLTFGMLCSFYTSFIVQPYMNTLASEQVYI